LPGIRGKPELPDAIKAQLNRDLRPGRNVLAGSTRYAAIPAAAQALTGRVDIIPVLPLTQSEIDGVRETFVTKLLDGDDIEGPPPGTAAATREEYARRAASGGMPVALRGLGLGPAAQSTLVITPDRQACPPC
jgi:uncharacterized protein